MMKHVKHGHASNPKIAVAATVSVAAAAFGCCLLVSVWFTSSTDACEFTAADTACELAAMAILPNVTLADARPDVPGEFPVTLGGLSDLALVDRAKSGDTFSLRMLTDRGPTTKVTVGGKKRRVFLNTSFTPKLLDVVVSGYAAAKDSSTPVSLKAEIRSVLDLRTAAGTLVSGRPNGLPGDESVATPDGKGWLQPDANGVDPEGLAVLSDGSFWITEEYRPSILRCDSNSTLTARYVPRGIRLSGADMDVYDNLPARYAARKDNRGFEATALSPDEGTLWALLQSPLEFPEKNSAVVTGNIRLLAFDGRAGRPTAEYIYRLGDPNHPAYLNAGVRLDDGKLCAMAAINDDSLLVLEQSDAGDAKLYRCCWKNATNTLADDRGLEAIGNLRDNGIACLEKTLVADLAPLLLRLAADITDGHWQPDPDEPVSGLKLEGLVILDSHHIVIGNDNDFDVDHLLDQDKPIRRSCLWVIALGQAL